MIAPPPSQARVPLSKGRALDLSVPRVMGVLNATPDSFSDGGRHLAPEAAVAAGLAMVEAGAAVLDVGGESTRPGATPVSAAEELERVLPVVAALIAAGVSVPISVDTRKASVAEAALAAGCSLVNDVTGLGDPDMAGVVAAAGAALIVGHIRGVPESMQHSPRYESLLDEVHGFLAEACRQAREAGVDARALLVDPGIGFGKTLEHNLALLANLERFADLAPVAVGISRKSMLGALTGGRPPNERLSAGVGGAVWSALCGARLIRTHDVRPTVDALHVAWSIRGHRVA